MPSEKPRSATPHLSTGQRLPDLRIVSAEQLYLHEESDPVRVARLAERMRDEGILRNPPVVAPLPEDAGFVVLDGANRTSALINIGASALPVQVVDYDDPAVRLDIWHHFLTDAADLATRLASPGLAVRPASAEEAERLLAARTIACYFATRAGAYLVAQSLEVPPAATLAKVVGAYKGTVRIYRVLTTDLDTLSSEYGTDGTVVVFPLFTKRDILEIARAPVKLPTGITRHLITGRALRVNVPLNILTSPGEIDGKTRWLAQTIHQKLLDNRIRYYPEASFLFDE